MSYAELDTASIHLEASYVWMYFLFQSVNSFHSPPQKIVQTPTCFTLSCKASFRKQGLSKKKNGGTVTCAFLISANKTRYFFAKIVIIFTLRSGIRYVFIKTLINKYLVEQKQEFVMSIKKSPKAERFRDFLIQCGRWGSIKTSYPKLI